MELASRYEAAGGEGTVVIEVLDRGCGIPDDKLEEVQRPFVTTKTHGTGLKLVIVQRTASLHRARFALARREGAGRLPRSASVRRLAPVAAEVAPSREGQVLFVDDDLGHPARRPRQPVARGVRGWSPPPRR